MMETVRLRKQAKACRIVPNLARVITGDDNRRAASASGASPAPIKKERARRLKRLLLRYDHP